MAMSPADEAADRIQRIEARLRAVLEPQELEIEDESHRHRGHAGAREGGGHFAVRIVSEAFAGKNRLARHRLVYDTLEAEMGTEIHALSVQASTPEEAAAS